MLHELTIKVDVALPKELSPNWKPRYSSAQAWYGMRERVRSVFKDVVILKAREGRSQWENARFGEYWPVLEKCHLSVTLVLEPRKQEWDDDNAWAALKSAVDMIVHAELIKDDNRQCIVSRRLDYKRGDSPAIIFYIRERECKILS